MPPVRTASIYTGSGIRIPVIHENLASYGKSSSERLRKTFHQLQDAGFLCPENREFIRMYQDVADEVYIDKPHSWIKVEGADFIKNYYKGDTDDVMKDLKMDSTAGLPVPCLSPPWRFATTATSPLLCRLCRRTNLGNMDRMSLPELWNIRPLVRFSEDAARRPEGMRIIPVHGVTSTRAATTLGTTLTGFPSRSCDNG